MLLRSMPALLIVMALLLVFNASVFAAQDESAEDDEAGQSDSEKKTDGDLEVNADSENEETSNKSDEENAGEKEVVVTATRTPHEASDAPVPTSVVSSHEIVCTGAMDAGDALECVPGVFVDEYESAGRGGPGSGVNIQGLPTDRVLVLIDGQRIPWSMRAPDLELIPAQLIHRIEVIKGPSSSLYGSDAVGGVINIITKNPTTDPTAELDISGGSFSTFGQNLFHSWGAGPVGWVINFNREQGQGWIDANASRSVIDPGEGIVDTIPKPFKDGHPYETNDIFGKVTYSPTPSLYFTAGTRYHWEDNQFEDTDDGAVSDNKVRFSSMVTGQYDKGKFSIKALGSYFQRYLRYRETSTSYVYSPLPPPDLLRTTIDKGNDTLGNDFNADIIASGFLADWNLLSGGLSWRHEQLDYSAFETSSFTEADQTYMAYQTVHSAYLQDEMFFFHNIFSVVPGVRLDYHDLWGTVVNPKLSALLKSSHKTAMRASIGQAFKEPTLSQLYRPTFRHSGYYMTGNEDLVPESVLGWNVELEQGITRYLFLTAGYFQYEITDMIYPVIDQEDKVGGLPVMSYTNLKQARIYGSEGTLRVFPHKVTNLIFNYTWTRTFDLDENISLGTVPEHNAGVRWFFDYKPWGLGAYAGATYQSMRDYIGMGGRWYKAEQRWMTNARIYKSIGSHVELGFRVSNWLGYKWDRDGDEDNDMPPTSYYGDLKLSL